MVARNLTSTKDPALGDEATGGEEAADQGRGLAARALDLELVNDRYERTQALAHVGSWAVDHVTKERWWSAETYRIFGREPGSPLPRFGEALEAFHPDDHALIEATVRRSLASPEVLEIQHRLKLPDGRVKHVRAQMQTMFSPDGVPLRSEGTVQDITDIVHGEARLRSILDGLFIFVGVYDRDGRRIEVNQAPLDALGARRADVIGEPFWEGYAWSPSPGTKTQARVAFERALAGEAVREDFVIRITADRLMMVDGTFGPLRDASGQIIGVVASAVDITARLAAEEKVREREARLAAVFNHTSDVMVLFAIGDDGEPRVLAANRGAVTRINQFGKIDDAELIGLTFTELSRDIYKRPADVVADNRARIATAIEKREPVTFENVVHFPSGPYYGEVSIVPIVNDEGRCTQLLWSSHDVTQRKQAEAQMRVSLAEKETLVREIHHRVKNNLQVIMSLLHFQAKKHGGPENAAGFAELRQRVLAMTLVHERLYQSKDVSRVDFGDYVRAVIAGLRRTFEPRPGLRIDVESDEVHLPIELALPCGMIVCELITNVFKYAFPDGRDGAATVNVRSEGEHVALEVHDDGVGLPAGFDAGGKRGFGWELIRGIVVQIDGDVQATSDRGTHVRVTFPAPLPAHGALPRPGAE